jgi:putative transposase
MIRQLSETYTLERACAALMVSPSGYYAWKERQTQPPSLRMQRDQELTAQIHTLYAQSHCTYGSPRIHAQLRQVGVRCSKH